MRFLALLRLLLPLLKRKPKEPEAARGGLELPVFRIGPTTYDFRVTFKGEDVTEQYPVRRLYFEADADDPRIATVHLEVEAVVEVEGEPERKAAVEVDPRLDPVTGHVEAPHLGPEPEVFVHDRTERGTPREVVLPSTESDEDIGDALRRAHEEGGTLEIEVEVGDGQPMRLTGARVTELPRRLEDVQATGATSAPAGGPFAAEAPRAPLRPAYGFCPRCGSAGIQRLRDAQRPKETVDRCLEGHLYPSSESRPAK